MTRRLTNEQAMLRDSFRAIDAIVSILMGLEAHMDEGQRDFYTALYDANEIYGDLEGD